MPLKIPWRAFKCLDCCSGEGMYCLNPEELSAVSLDKD